MKMKMLALLFSSLIAQSAFAAAEVNVYSNRQDELIKPIIQQFEKETGIKVNVVFAKEGLNERLEREGKLSPADLMLTVDISRLTDLVDKDLVQPVDSKTLQENIPSIYRDPDNKWFALTTRVRAIYSSKDRLGKLDTIRLAEHTNLGVVAVIGAATDVQQQLLAPLVLAHPAAQQLGGRGLHRRDRLLEHHQTAVQDQTDHRHYRYTPGFHFALLVWR